jgi:4-amino-4-deoxy-L-arabinose transferase-like glycosyltransferase
VSARECFLRLLAPALLLATMAGLMVDAARHKRLVYDEVDNLAYGRRYLREGPAAIPHGQRMPVLALNALGCIHRQCRTPFVNRSDQTRLLARAATIVAVLALGVVVYAWAGALFGPLAALAALWLHVFNPNMLGHGKQVTSDVPAALFTALAVYLLWRHLRGPRVLTFVGAAAATAAAILAKITSVLLLPVMAGLFAAHLALARERPRLTRRGAARGLGRGLAFLLLVLAFVNAGYQFDGTFTPAAGIAWRSQALQPLRGLQVPLLLPRALLWTLDQSYLVQEDPRVGRGANYVLGQLNTDGRWYAFPLMVLLKTPLALFALLAWALWLRAPGERPALALWLLGPALAWVAFFSLFVKPQIGVRYLLPAFPFLFVLAARPTAAARGRTPRLLLGALLLWYAGSSLSYRPHYVAYFNEAIGSRLDAYRYLADSNLEWEDAFYWVTEYRLKHPDRPFAYEPRAPQAGWVLVSANELVGIFDPERFRWLRENFRPLDHVAYGHLLFYVPPERVDELKRRYGFP